MRVPKQIEIEQCFNNIWETWLNKKHPNAGLKALEVCLKSGKFTMDTIELACSIYALEHEGDDFTYQLNNFLMQDTWRDILDGAKDAEDYKKQLQKKHDEAVNLIKTWNAERNEWWAEVLDIQERVPLAKAALQNSYFYDHWKKALDKAKKIFQYRAREGERNSKLIISFSWFANVSTNKHTVLKIDEGEFGGPQGNHSISRPVYKELSQEDHKELKSLWDEIKELPLDEVNKELNEGSPATPDKKDVDLGFA